MENIIKDLHLRQYEDRDYDTVWELHFEGLKQTGTIVKDRTWDNDLLNIKNHYLDDRGDFLIVTFNTEIIGIGGLRKINRETCEIKRMRVKFDYQRKGIGTFILKTLMDKAWKLDYRRIILDTSDK